VEEARYSWLDGIDNARKEFVNVQDADFLRRVAIESINSL
jgi:hypothetical protein